MDKNHKEVLTRHIILGIYFMGCLCEVKVCFVLFICLMYFFDKIYVTKCQNKQQVELYFKAYNKIQTKENRTMSIFASFKLHV